MFNQVRDDMIEKLFWEPGQTEETRIITIAALNSFRLPQHQFLWWLRGCEGDIMGEKISTLFWTLAMIVGLVGMSVGVGLGYSLIK